MKDSNIEEQRAAFALIREEDSNEDIQPGKELKEAGDAGSTLGRARICTRTMKRESADTLGAARLALATERAKSTDDFTPTPPVIEKLT